jgi:hypothetical protein
VWGTALTTSVQNQFSGPSATVSPETAFESRTLTSCQDELDICELIEYSVELKLHCILLCGVYRDGQGWMVRNLYTIHLGRDGAGMLTCIARSKRYYGGDEAPGPLHVVCRLSES